MIEQMQSLGWQLVAIVLGILFLLIILAIVLLIWWRMVRNGKTNKIESAGTIDQDFIIVESRAPKIFAYSELCQATNNFSQEQKLGEGEFGSVYKGTLRNPDLEIAVKRITRGSKQWRKEYMSDVKIISRLKHNNLVQLHGWCHEQGELILVYEFITNGDLTKHLYSQKFSLIWPTRYNITIGLASAILHLHEQAAAAAAAGGEQSVLHRNIKSSNVMLDSNFNPKLGDFNPTRLINQESITQTRVIAATLGYLAPECYATGETSKESDVYSFGIVVLEIVCGRKPVDDERTSFVSLIEWVWDLYAGGKENVVDAVDKKLGGEFNERQVECLLVVGLWCCHRDQNLRPSMKEVLSVLKFEAPLPELTI